MWLIYMEGKGCEAIIHDHDCDLWLTMVGWLDVPESDWGDMRHWRAVNISNFVVLVPWEWPFCHMSGFLLPLLATILRQNGIRVCVTAETTVDSPITRLKSMRSLSVATQLSVGAHL